MNFLKNILLNNPKSWQPLIILKPIPEPHEIPKKIFFLLLD